MQRFTESLPDASKKDMDFEDSSYFRKYQHLPTPAQVKASSRRPKRKTVIFDNLNLLVKFGPDINVEEARNLWIVKRAFHLRVPVPEVFGWRVDEENMVFIYVELIRGPTLQERWDDLTIVDKTSLREQLCQIMKVLRELEQDPMDQYIGTFSEYLLRNLLRGSSSFQGR